MRPWLMTLCLLAACGGKDTDTPPTTLSETDTDTDTDSDADTDTDTDADSDADTDADTDTDTDADSAMTADTGTGGGSTFEALDGFGDLSGACNVLDDGEWLSSDPFLFRSSVDFGSDAFDKSLLSADGEAIIDAGGLNSNSVESEAIAFEALYRCELAGLLKTEAEVVYADPNGKKTDVLADIDARPIGVSVTRALTFVDPTNRCGTPSAGAMESLLSDKLSDLPLSQANAATTSDAWERSILSVVACDAAHADAIETAWNGLAAGVKGDHIVMVLVTEGDDLFLYD